MDVFHYVFRISHLTKKKRFFLTEMRSDLKRQKTIQIYVGMINDLINRRNVEG